MGDDIQKQTGYAWDSSGLNVVEQTGAATAHTVAQAADDAAHFRWPWWAWVAVAAGGLVVAAPVFNLAAAAINRKKSAA